MHSSCILFYAIFRTQMRSIKNTALLYSKLAENDSNYFQLLERNIPHYRGKNRADIYLRRSQFFIFFPLNKITSHTIIHVARGWKKDTERMNK